MTKSINTIFCLIFLIYSLQVNAQNFTNKFDSKNNIKAKGLWVTVRYPQGWVAKDGERPNIVQKFSGDVNGFYTILMLQIINAGAPVEKECHQTTAKQYENDLEDIPNGAFAVNTKKIIHEKKPGFIYDVQAKVERSGVSTLVHQRIMSICYKDKLVTLICNPMKLDTSARKITSTFKDLDDVSNVCFQFFNSLVLMDTYN